MTQHQRVYSCLHPFEAHVVANHLRHNGVAATVRNERLNRLLGAIPMSESMVEVWVPDDDVANATELLAAMAAIEATAGVAPDAPEPPTPAAPQCGHCGAPWERGFDVCWNCGSAL